MIRGYQNGKAAAMAFGLSPWTYATTTRTKNTRADRPARKIQPEIAMSSMDDKSRIARLEERTDTHGEGNREIRVKLKEQDVDIKDLYRNLDLLRGGLKVAKWIWGTATALIIAIIEVFRK